MSMRVQVHKSKTLKSLLFEARLAKAWKYICRAYVYKIAKCVVEVKKGEEQNYEIWTTKIQMIIIFQFSPILGIRASKSGVSVSVVQHARSTVSTRACARSSCDLPGKRDAAPIHS